MIISVASGTGSTGKTTIATNLAVGVTRALHLPGGLVINRADLGDRRVHEYAARENLPILLEIPFDREAAEVFARGGLLVEELPRWRRLMAELLAKLNQVCHYVLPHQLNHKEAADDWHQDFQDQGQAGSRPERIEPGRRGVAGETGGGIGKRKRVAENRTLLCRKPG
jgi:hypothetical protein